MAINQLESIVNYEINKISEKDAKTAFNHILTAMAYFKEYSFENILILSNKLANSEVSTSKVIPLDTIRDDIRTIELYDEHNPNKSRWVAIEDVSGEPEKEMGTEADEWYAAMPELFMNIKTGFNHTLPDLITGISWRPAEAGSIENSYIKKTGNISELVIVAHKNNATFTFWDALKAYILELLDHNAGFNNLDMNMKSELAGIVALAYFKDQRLTNPRFVQVSPDYYLREYPGQARTYLKMVHQLLLLLSPVKNDVSEIPQVSSSTDGAVSLEELENMVDTSVDDTTFEPDSELSEGDFV